MQRPQQTIVVEVDVATSNGDIQASKLHTTIGRIQRKLSASVKHVQYKLTCNKIIALNKICINMIKYSIALNDDDDDDVKVAYTASCQEIEVNDTSH